MPKDLPKDLAMDMHKDLAMDLPKDLPMDVPKDLSKNMPNDLPVDLPKDLPKELPKNTPPKCSFCGVIFKWRRKLESHIQAVHKGKTKVNEISSRVFRKRANLDHQIKANPLWPETKIRPFDCEKCDQKFRRRGHLLRHIQTVHEQLKSFKCETCQSTFTQKRNFVNHQLKVHQTTEVKIDLLKCKVCSLVFPTTTSLFRHVTIKRCVPKVLPKDLLQCFCGVIFKKRRNLETHIQAIHKVKSPFICKICNNRFSNKQHLQRHQTKLVKCVKQMPKDLPKLVERPFVCEKCDKKFPRRGHLLRHIHGVHEQLKPFKCETCQSVFSQKRTLVDHQERVHQTSSSLCKHVVLKHCVLKETPRMSKNEAEMVTKVNGISSSAKKVIKSDIITRLFKCLECSFSTEESGDMITHHLSVHTISPSKI
jgi:uncharacterized C2H2 Zn-finger protein